MGYTLRNVDRWNLRSVAREITGEIYKMKQRAIKENRPVRITFTTAHEYSFFIHDGVSWQSMDDRDFQSMDIGEKVTVNSPLPDFAINSRGFLVKATAPNQFSLIGTQNIVLTSMGNQGLDTMTISIFPYGGINVEKQFQ
jgi:hypothetical protein